MFISEVARVFWIDISVVVKLLQLFLHCRIELLSTDFESLFDTVLGQDCVISYDVGWWGGFNRGGYGVDVVNILLGNIMEGTRTNNQVDLTHGASMGSFIIVVYDGGIL